MHEETIPRSGEGVYYNMIYDTPGCTEFCEYLMLGKTVEKDILHVLNGQKLFSFVNGDSAAVLKVFPSESVDCVITSPPYWKMREYDVATRSKSNIIGNEPSVQEYVSRVSSIFKEIHRILRPEGSVWLNLGDKYHHKNLLGLPWRVALSMQDSGWILRNDVIWDQMKGTQSARDRLRDVYEHVFHFVKSPKYYYAHNEIRIKPRVMASTRNGTVQSATGVTGVKYRRLIESSTCLNATEKRNALMALDATLDKLRNNELVDFRMTIRGEQRAFHSESKNISGRAKELATKGYYFISMGAKGFLPTDIWRIPPEDKCRRDSHCAVFPEALLATPILATCPKNGIVLDPFSGTGSTACAALSFGRKTIGIELSHSYNSSAARRAALLVTRSHPHAHAEKCCL